MGIIWRSRQQSIGSSALEPGLVPAERREHDITDLSRRGSFRDRAGISTSTRRAHRPLASAS
jgi:hypothetical protein